MGIIDWTRNYMVTTLVEEANYRWDNACEFEDSDAAHRLQGDMEEWRFVTYSPSPLQLLQSVIDFYSGICTPLLNLGTAYACRQAASLLKPENLVESGFDMRLLDVSRPVWEGFLTDDETRLLTETTPVPEGPGNGEELVAHEQSYDI